MHQLCIYIRNKILMTIVKCESLVWPTYTPSALIYVGRTSSISPYYSGMGQTDVV